MPGPKRKLLLPFLAAGCFLLPLVGISAADDQEKTQEMREMRQLVRTACGESAESLCAEARGPRARMKCLMDRYEEVSAECQALLDEVEEERERRRELLAAACGTSMETLCPDLKGPGMVRCLKNSYEQTSADCQAFLDEIPDRRGPGPRGRW
jgi:hypothetical protein